MTAWLYRLAPPAVLPFSLSRPAIFGQFSSRAARCAGASGVGCAARLAPRIARMLCTAARAPLSSPAGEFVARRCSRAGTRRASMSARKRRSNPGGKPAVGGLSTGLQPETPVGQAYGTGVAPSPDPTSHTNPSRAPQQPASCQPPPTPPTPSQLQHRGQVGQLVQDVLRVGAAGPPVLLLLLAATEGAAGARGAPRAAAGKEGRERVGLGQRRQRRPARPGCAGCGCGCGATGWWGVSGRWSGGSLRHCPVQGLPARSPRAGPGLPAAACCQPACASSASSDRSEASLRAESARRVRATAAAEGDRKAGGEARAQHDRRRRASGPGWPEGWDAGARACTRSPAATCRSAEVSRSSAALRL
jgi:hypothetical protein